ncbi:MAG: phage tail spike protein [Peptostreptococcus porci]|nr:phage tail spike protein [Peptostreptococcus porci]
MIRLFYANDTQFNTNGVEILDPYIIDPVISEQINGIFGLEFRLPIFASQNMEKENLIVCDTPKFENQAFRISSVRKSMGFYFVKAYHIFYDLIDNLIEDINIVNAGASTAILKIQDGCANPHNFKFYTDIQNRVNNCRIVRCNPVQALIGTDDNNFVNRWGGEIERDNFNVWMRGRVGTTTDVKIRYRKNLIGYEAEIDYTQITTKIMPKGYDGLLLPEKYVESSKINNYHNKKIKVIEYPDVKVRRENESEGLTESEAFEELRRLARLEFTQNEIDVPKANYKVDFVDLAQTEEYKDIQALEKVYLGDSIQVIHEKENLNITARVISYKFNPLTKRYIEIELGNYVEGFTSISKTVREIHNKIDNEISTALEDAKTTATNLIKGGFGGFVKIYPDRILIMDTDNEGTAKNVWQWNKNGFGFSNTGINGTYDTAMTMDGAIVADFITSGSLNANIITAGKIKGQNFDLDLDSGLMKFGVGAITKDSLTADLKNELKGEKGDKGATGAQGPQGPQGIPGTLAELPPPLKQWNSNSTEISGKYVFTPELFVGTTSPTNSTKTGVYIGENVGAKAYNGATSYWSGITLIKNGYVNGLISNEGWGFFGRDPNRRLSFYSDGTVSMWKITADEIASNSITAEHIQSDSINTNHLQYGSITGDKIKTGELTTDYLYPGTNNRIVLERGYSPGSNNAMSIDANNNAIRLKFSSGTYFKASNAGCEAFYAGDLLFKAGGSNYTGISVANGTIMDMSNNSSNINIRGSEFFVNAQGSTIFNASSSGAWSNGTYLTSDAKLKENIQKLGSDVVLHKNEKVDNDIFTTEEICDFVKNLPLYNYNFKFDTVQHISTMTQNIKGKFRDTLVRYNELSKCYSIEIYNYVSILNVALQEEMKKTDELKKEVEDLKQEISKIKELLNT